VKKKSGKTRSQNDNLIKLGGAPFSRLFLGPSEPLPSTSHYKEKFNRQSDNVKSEMETRPKDAMFSALKSSSC